MTTRTIAPAEVVLFETRIAPSPVHGALTHLEGRAIPYGVWTNRGWFLESIAPGAVAKSIAEAASRLPLLLFHDDRTWPVGVSESWQDTATYLDGVWRLDESDEAQRAAQQAHDGILTGLSVGITPYRSDWSFVPVDDWNPDLGEDHMDRVTRVEARLVETSMIPTPAFDSARVKLVHSAVPRRAGGLGPSAHPRLDAARAWRSTIAT
jgi:hypothetical protein